MCVCVQTAHAVATTHDSVEKWRQLGDLALTKGNDAMAEAGFVKAKDVEALLLFYVQRGNKQACGPSVHCSMVSVL